MENWARDERRGVSDLQIEWGKKKRSRCDAGREKLSTTEQLARGKNTGGDKNVFFRHVARC